MAVYPLHRYSLRLLIGVIAVASLGFWLPTARALATPADSTITGPTISVNAPPLSDLVRRGRLARRPGRPRVALALSGGGARGIAQIGILRALEDADIEIDLICGVSMGAIIGGLYASGISTDSLEALARDIRWGDMIRNTPPRAQLLLSQKSNEANWFVSIPIRDFRPQWPTGAISGQLLYNFLSQLTQGPSYRCEGDFNRLPIRYRAVATELVTGHRAVFSGGELAYAMRAAFAYPLAVTPLRNDSLLYADGGLVDPLPVQLAASLSKYPVVAVNTATGLTGIDKLNDPYAVANQATSVMTIPLIKESLAEADYVCTPDVGQTANFEFSAVDSLVAAGYAAGQRLADQILADASRQPSSLPDSVAILQGRLTLATDMFEGDCPADVSLLLSSGDALTGTEVHRLLQREIADGWWDSATVVYRAPAAKTPAAWVLSARRPPVLTKVRFDSLHVFSADTLRAVVGLATGMRHDRWAIATAVNRIVTFYAVHNYTLTDVENVSLTEDGILTIRVDEALLDQLTLSGNRTVKSWVILRSFPMKEGRPYNTRLVERGLNDLQATGLFEQITTEVRHSPEGPILHLSVTEKSTDALRLGLRHDLEYQTDVFVEWASINVLGLGNELVAHAQHAPRRDWFFLRAQASRVLRTYLTGALTLYRKRHDRHFYTDHEQNGGFETHRLGFELFFGQHITREAQLAMLLDVEDLDLQIHGDSMSTNYDVARIALVARADDLDDRDFPTSGRRLTAQLRWADEFFGGDIVYRAFDGEGMWVESPTDRLTLLGSARFATAERHLPVFEQFSLGGLNSFMGLNDDEYLGDKLLRTSIMGRYQFFARSYFAARFDVGTVWAHNAQIDFFKDLLFGIGGGLMFDTPLGPLEIMGGHAEGGYSKFYLSWGYEF